MPVKIEISGENAQQAIDDLLDMAEAVGAPKVMPEEPAADVTLGPDKVEIEEEPVADPEPEAEPTETPEPVAAPGPSLLANADIDWETSDDDGPWCSLIHAATKGRNANGSLKSKTFRGENPFPAPFADKASYVAAVRAGIEQLRRILEDHAAAEAPLAVEEPATPPAPPAPPTPEQPTASAAPPPPPAPTAPVAPPPPPAPPAPPAAQATDNPTTYDDAAIWMSQKLEAGEVTEAQLQEVAEAFGMTDRTQLANMESLVPAFIVTVKEKIGG